MKNLSWKSVLVVLVLVIITSLALSACASSSPTKAAEPGTLLKVKVGASPVPHAEILAYIRDNLAAAAGSRLKSLNSRIMFSPTWR